METTLAFLFVMLAPVLLIPFAFVTYLIIGGVCIAVKMRMVHKFAERKGIRANLGPM